jgi:hypothetical protein
MNRRNIILLLFLSAVANFSLAQVTVVADPAIDLLVEKHVKANSEGRGFPGFRVQIFSDSGNGARERANDKRSSFVSKYPDVPAYLDFNNPNFIVRVGDFRTKLEARKFLNSINVEFPYAFVRKDMIQPPPID